MIDTASEQLLTLQQAADRMPISHGVGGECISPQSGDGSKLENSKAFAWVTGG